MSAINRSSGTRKPAGGTNAIREAERGSRDEQAAVVAGSVLMVAGVVLVVHGVTRQVLRRDHATQE